MVRQFPERLDYLIPPQLFIAKLSRDQTTVPGTCTKLRIGIRNNTGVARNFNWKAE